MLLGIEIRTHTWLSPSIENQVQEWTHAGFSKEQAQEFVAFLQLGIVPEGQKTAELPKSGSSNNGLFAAHGQIVDPIFAECGRLSDSRFSGINQRLEAMKGAGTGWKAFADAAEQVTDGNREAIVEKAYELACH